MLELICEFVCGHLVLRASKITKQGVYNSGSYSNSGFLCPMVKFSLALLKPMQRPSLAVVVNNTSNNKLVKPRPSTSKFSSLNCPLRTSSSLQHKSSITELIFDEWVCRPTRLRLISSENLG